MSSSSFAFLLALVLLGVSASAEPRLPECAEFPLQLELAAESAPAPHEVCISPEQPLLFFFDTPLMAGEPELRDRERFADVQIGTHGFTLLPGADLRPGERFEVKARFADGAAPASVTFTLVVHPVLGARRLDVRRHSRTLEDYQRENQVERQKSQRLGDELERTRAESGPGGITGLFASGLIQDDEETQGVVVKSLTMEAIRLPSNALALKHVLSCRTTTTRKERTQDVVRVAMVMRVKNPSAQPWMIQGAVLLNKGKEPRRAKVWQSAPLEPDSGGTGLVVVELELTAQEARGPFTLKAWDESGRRLVTLGNVTFP